jgi:hypothetical protein
LSGSEWEIVDLEEYETNDENDRDIGDSLVNTRYVPEPGSAPAAETEAGGSLAHSSNPHSDGATATSPFAGYVARSITVGVGKLELESESGTGSGSNATVVGGYGPLTACGRRFCRRCD